MDQDKSNFNVGDNSRPRGTNKPDEMYWFRIWKSDSNSFERAAATFKDKALKLVAEAIAKWGED